MPEAKPEIEVASSDAATLFKQRCWRSGPGNLYCCLGGMTRCLLDQKKKTLDTWSSWKWSLEHGGVLKAMILTLIVQWRGAREKVFSFALRMCQSLKSSQGRFREGNLQHGA